MSLRASPEGNGPKYWQYPLFGWSYLIFEYGSFWLSSPVLSVSIFQSQKLTLKYIIYNIFQIRQPDRFEIFFQTWKYKLELFF